jgi:hypothetical protein
MFAGSGVHCACVVKLSQLSQPQSPVDRACLILGCLSYSLCLKFKYIMHSKALLNKVGTAGIVTMFQQVVLLQRLIWTDGLLSSICRSRILRRMPVQRLPGVLIVCRLFVPSTLHVALHVYSVAHTIPWHGSISHLSLCCCCSKIAEAEAAVSVNEKKQSVMHMHVQLKLDELRGPPNPLLSEHHTCWYVHTEAESTLSHVWPYTLHWQLCNHAACDTLVWKMSRWAADECWREWGRALENYFLCLDAYTEPQPQPQVLSMQHPIAPDAQPHAAANDHILSASRGCKQKQHVQLAPILAHMAVNATMVCCDSVVQSNFPPRCITY